MPFDATPSPRTSIADKMRAILDRGWCKNLLRSLDDKSHCAMGALLEARGILDQVVSERLVSSFTEKAHDALIARVNADPDVIALSEAVAAVSPHHKRLHGGNHWSRIATFNNDPATSYDDIVRVLDEFAARTATKEIQNAL